MLAYKVWPMKSEAYHKGRDIYRRGPRIEIPDGWYREVNNGVVDKHPELKIVAVDGRYQLAAIPR